MPRLIGLAKHTVSPARRGGPFPERFAEADFTCDCNGAPCCLQSRMVIALFILDACNIVQRFRNSALLAQRLLQCQALSVMLQGQDIVPPQLVSEPYFEECVRDQNSIAQLLG